MARPPKTKPPVYAHRDATKAARAIRAGRLDAGDPNARLLPSDLRLDDDDFDLVIDYCEQHRDGVEKRVLDVELVHRALLMAYREQQAARSARRRERQLQTLLEHGRARGRGVPWFGAPLGLTSQSAWNRRNRFAQQDDLESAMPASTALTTWLDANRNELSEIGEALVDQRPDVLALVDDVEARSVLAEQVDDVGQALAPLPTLDFAELVATALTSWLAEPIAPKDPIMRDLVQRGRRLLTTFVRARDE
jgi:hypothetical protein